MGAIVPTAETWKRRGEAGWEKRREKREGREMPPRSNF